MEETVVETDDKALGEKKNDSRMIAKSIMLGSIIIAASIVGAAYLKRAPEKPKPVLGAATSSSAPDSVIHVTDRADQPVIGNPNAPLTLYEFSDFQCPYCTRFYKQTYNQIKTKYVDTGKLKLVYRQFPLTQIHVNAQKSAEAAECANRENKFEPYYNMLFENSHSDGAGLTVADLKKYAIQLGLNGAIFNECLDGGQSGKVVEEDLAEGVRVGVTGTPSFVLNGNLIAGAEPFATFEKAMEELK